MKISRTVTTLLMVSIFLSASLVAALAYDYPGKAVFSNAEDLIWQSAPPSLPRGAQMTVLLGDPSKPGPFAVRFSAPAEYTVPPHFHSRAEMLTILSGTLYMGTGTTFDPTSAHTLNVGAFHFLPAQSPHFVFTKTPTVVEIHGEGPFDIIYINPEDDPRR
jgi:quercetin dioxygenase-like cupin family protein